MSRAPIGMVVDERGLHPLDGYAQEQLAALPPGTYNVRFARMTAKYKEEREGMRGLWWAGLEVLANNTERRGYADKRQAHESILRAIGYTRPRYRMDHSFELIPISTAEESMDDAEFAIMQERARTYCIDEHGFDPWETWVNEQEAMNGGRR
jgi:hypothetical protein